MVTDMSGDAEADPDRVLGLFHRDVRHLSRWRLTVDGSPLQPLSTGASGYPAATFFLAGLGGNVYADPTLSTRDVSSRRRHATSHQLQRMEVVTPPARGSGWRRDNRKTPLMSSHDVQCDPPPR